MTTALWRFDYAKFVLDTPAGTFRQYYDAIREAAAQRKFNGDWNKSHKVTAYYSQSSEWERTAIEIWGEWAEVVHLLPYHVWARAAVRLDTRAIQWDVGEEAILYTGQRLQRTVSSRNIEVFSSKNASKRLGRDRGGKGFRIGSRKSDVCIVVYKRNQEPAATEYRFQGQALRNCLSRIDEVYHNASGTSNLWDYLKEDMRGAAEKRFNAAFREAGIGEYWPVYSDATNNDYEGLQASFILAERRQDAAEHDDSNWREEPPQKTLRELRDEAAGT